MEPVSRTRFRRQKYSPARWGRLLAILLFLVGLSRAEQGPLEYQVKAAFLLNFVKFVEWPRTAFTASDAPISICILGDDSVANALSQMVAGEVVTGRKLAVEKVKRAALPKTCQALFINKSEKDVPGSLAAFKTGVLTVGEEESFLREGGMIAFVIENRRVRFDINQGAAQNAGLKLSSKLLSVARSVAN